MTGTLRVSALRFSATSIDHLFSNSPQQGNHYVKYTVRQVEISSEVSVSAVYIVFMIGGLRFDSKRQTAGANFFQTLLPRLAFFAHLEVLDLNKLWRPKEDVFIKPFGK